MGRTYTPEADKMIKSDLKLLNMGLKLKYNNTLYNEDNMILKFDL